MKTLSETWFAEGYIDFELKKYTLLAYLQEINRGFGENKLYPQLADIIFHYNNIVAFRENKKYMQEHFPKRLNGIQMERLSLFYEKVIEDSELMKEMEDIIEFATAHMKTTINEGAGIYEFVEDKINIQPVGLVPLNITEGYFFLNNGHTSNTHIYQYKLTFFEQQDAKYRGIKTDYIDCWQRSFSTSYENIKAALIKAKKEMPNPAVYALETPLSFPVEETLLPVAKRYLAKFIATAA